MPNELDVDVAVIGAGVVGLAAARALARRGREVVVLESERAIALHTSSRNSEVIHAGIYYEPGSLKARLCVAGKQLLYAYCAENRIPHRQLGKLIVATSDEELTSLQALRERALANGVELAAIDAREVRELESGVRAVAALWSPTTGIVDSHALMAALRRDAERAGASLVMASPVIGGRLLDDAVELQIGGTSPTQARCRTVVNAAGLYAPHVARSIQGVPAATIPEPAFAKGHYFTMRGAHPFRHLVYPVPVAGGLGVHVTLDLAGQVRFGPDVQWVDGIDYRFDESRAPQFYEAIRRYYPALPDGALVAGYTGVRPKIAGSNDFVVERVATGSAQLVSLFGVESPGLTAALALADSAYWQIWMQ